MKNILKPICQTTVLMAFFYAGAMWEKQQIKNWLMEQGAVGVQGNPLDTPSTNYVVVEFPAI